MKKRKDLPQHLRDQRMVVQRYFKKPLLLDEGRTFDLRIYAVLVGFDPIHAFICNEGFARIGVVSKAIISFPLSLK